MTAQRIVSLLSSATEILFALGAGDRVVAVGHECDYPPDVNKLPRVTHSMVDSSQDSGSIDDQVKRLVEAGEPLYGVDQQRIVELQPDIIVTQSQCDVCAVRYQDVLDFVEQTPQLRGTPVVALSPMSLDEVFADIRRVAAAIGLTAAGDRLVASLNHRVQRVTKATATVEDERPRVACIEWIEPLMLSANWMPELVGLAGANNAIQQAGHSTYSRWEDLLEFDPEVIVIMPCGFDLERSIIEAEPLSRRDGWSDLKAVQQGQVFAVDGNAYFNRSGPRLVDSLEILAHLIHPEQFPATALAENARHSFRKFGG